eukprot:2523950-Karenia_brevis.AAC.1
MATSVQDGCCSTVLSPRIRILKEQLVVTHPSVREQLRVLEHQISDQGGTLTRQGCGQMWRNKKQMLGHSKCPGLEIRGEPQKNRPWIVPPGHDIQW